MALESQGVTIRRVSTEATGISTVTSSVITVTSSGIESSDTAEANFLDAGSSFTTGMRIEITATLSTYAVASTMIYTVDAVTKAKLTLHESATADAGTSLHIKGMAMLPIAEVISFSGPSGSPAIINVTNLQSAAHEKLVGVRDEGQISLEVCLNASATALQLAMNDDRIARTLRQYEIELTDSSTRGTFYFFDAYVTGFTPSGAVDDAIKTSITLDITDECHWTPTTV